MWPFCQQEAKTRKRKKNRKAEKLWGLLYVQKWERSVNRKSKYEKLKEAKSSQA